MMSDTTTAERERFLAELRHMNEETAKFVAEHHKLIAERVKLAAEARKPDRDRRARALAGRRRIDRRRGRVGHVDPARAWAGLMAAWAALRDHAGWLDNAAARNYLKCLGS